MPFIVPVACLLQRMQLMQARAELRTRFLADFYVVRAATYAGTATTATVLHLLGA